MRFLEQWFNGSMLCSAVVVLHEFGMVTVLQLLIWNMGAVRINVLKVLKH